jgi:hypothetical protein
LAHRRCLSNTFSVSYFERQRAQNTISGRFS